MEQNDKNIKAYKKLTSVKTKKAGTLNIKQKKGEKMTIGEVITIVCFMFYIVLVVDIKFKQHLKNVNAQEKQKTF